MDIMVKENLPLISVIVPVYNVGRFLTPCLDSIMAQTYTNLEILLINDGSTDGSGEVCDSYAEKDPRFRAIHKENGGVSSARNLALELAAGKYIAFVDSDDCIMPDYFEVLYSDLITHNADASFCNYRMVGEMGEEIPLPAPRFANQERMCDCEKIMANVTKWGVVWGGLILADWAKQFRFTGLRYGEDSLYMFELLRQGKPVYLDTYVGYDYLQRGDSATATKRIPNILKERDHLIVYAQRYLRLPEVSDQLRQAFLLRYATQMHRLAFMAAQPENKLHQDVCEQTVREHLAYVLPVLKELPQRLRVIIWAYARAPWFYRFYARNSERLRRHRKV